MTFIFKVEIFAFEANFNSKKNADEELTPPTLSIEDIDAFGVVKVKFTREMDLLSNATLINSTTFELTIISEIEDELRDKLLNFTWMTTTTKQSGKEIEL